MFAGAPETNIPPEIAAPVAEPSGRASLLEPNLWSWNDLALFLAFAALAFLVSNLLVAVGYVGIRSVAGAHNQPAAVPENPFLPLTLQLLFYGMLFAIIYLLVVAYHHRPFWSSLNWRKPTARQAIGYMLGGLMMAIGVQLAPTILPDQQNFPLERMFTSPLAAYAVAAFAVLIAPFMEELIFRGVLFAVFERRVSVRFAVATTAVLFAALHVPEYRGAWNHLLLICLVSGVFSLARGLTGSLAPSVILHFAYNLSLMAALYFGTQHFRALQGTIAAVLF
jgi:membrane protease YdiL (CAAX protease family)